MVSTTTPSGQSWYYIPQPSHWPIVGAVALLLMGMGAAFWFNGYGLGGISVALGFATLVFMLFGWFGKVISESQAHVFSKRVDISFRWAMSWFIFSEVMFFAAFFGALFYVRNLSVPDLGAGTITGSTLWPSYSAQWPTEGPYFTQRFTPMGAMGIPLLNTIILLTSGVTLTIAHHALKAGHRGALAEHWSGTTTGMQGSSNSAHSPRRVLSTALIGERGGAGSRTRVFRVFFGTSPSAAGESVSGHRHSPAVGGNPSLTVMSRRTARPVPSVSRPG